jgi:hypothetical protein
MKHLINTFTAVLHLTIIVDCMNNKRARLGYAIPVLSNHYNIALVASLLSTHA